MADARALDRLLTPGKVLGALAVLVAVTVLITPRAGTPGADQRLTSYSTNDAGARGLFETARRLGWRAERRLAPMRAALDSGAVYAVLDPPIDLTAGEVGHLLDAVRAGAGLVAIPSRGTALADSLRVRQSPPQYWTLEVPMDSSGKEPRARNPALAPFHNEVSYYLEPTAPLGKDTVSLLAMIARITPRRRGARADTTYELRPVVLGIPIGKGRVVAVADPALLRNEFLRDEPARAVVPVRALEWVTPGTLTVGRRLVFDEYHQGFGAHASTFRAIRTALLDTTPGRVVTQLLAAVLVLMVAAMARPVAPPARLRIERRSPLEHVGALARAYEQVGATRLATRRLLHGLRRRHAAGAARALADEEYLRAVAARYPALAGEVSRVLVAAHAPVAAPAFREVGDAIATIDRTLSQ